MAWTGRTRSCLPCGHLFRLGRPRNSRAQFPVCARLSSNCEAVSCSFVLSGGRNMQFRICKVSQACQIGFSQYERECQRGQALKEIARYPVCTGPSAPQGIRSASAQKEPQLSGRCHRTRTSGYAVCSKPHCCFHAGPPTCFELEKLLRSQFHASSCNSQEACF